MSVEGKKNWAPNPDITAKELKAMRVEVLDNIIVARVGLLLRHPFFGNMATRLRIKSADDWCPTAAVDGRNLYYNTQFFHAMSNKEIEFVIAHEILHCVFDHFTRREDRDAMIHNIASDYIVNNLLVRDNIGEMPKLIDCYQDFKYNDWTSEAVYDDIFKNLDEKELEQLGELLDEHVDWSKDEGNGDGAGEKNGNGKPSYSKDELRKIREEIKEGMMQA
ncbi:uncharacterized protein METZ01_LOCUS220684, partial [marine metagenome]